MSKTNGDGKKTDGRNKADVIREVFTTNPKATVKEVQAALATKGLTVSENHVYFIRSKMKDKRKRARQVAAVETSRASGTQNPALAVTKVKTLARELGGLRNLKQLVDVLVE